MEPVHAVERDEELAILNRGRDKVEKAKRVARDCPVGFLVVHDTEAQRVFYRDTNSVREISTDFTEDDIHIASRLLPAGHQGHLDWDRPNTAAAGRRYEVYTAQGK
jgi:hypothetical protein